MAVNAVKSWQFEGYTFFAHKIPGNAACLYQVSELRTGRRAGPWSELTATDMKRVWLEQFTAITSSEERKAHFHQAIDSVHIDVMSLPETAEDSQ